MTENQKRPYNKLIKELNDKTVALLEANYKKLVINRKTGEETC